MCTHSHICIFTSAVFSVQLGWIFIVAHPVTLHRHGDRPQPAYKYTQFKTLKILTHILKHGYTPIMCVWHDICRKKSVKTTLKPLTISHMNNSAESLICCCFMHVVHAYLHIRTFTWIFTSEHERRWYKQRTLTQEARLRIPVYDLKLKTTW